VASNSSLDETVIVTSVFAPNAKEVFGMSSLTDVFGFLNILKKPTAPYLLMNIFQKNRGALAIYVCSSKKAAEF
jgi:hypothetical protein